MAQAAVVSNTSPLNYLILVGHIEVLPAMYSAVAIPPEVSQELSSPRSPATVASWIQQPPAWLSVVPGAWLDPRLEMELDAGENAAIGLALHLPRRQLLIDDARGRSAARSAGLQTVGTLGVLVAASRAGLLDLPDALHALACTNFRMPRALFEALLASGGQISESS